MIDIPEAHLLNTMELIDDMDVMVSNYSMKFDLYIDVSGSMGSKVDLSTNGVETISRISLAKILAYRMKNMNILNNVYIFNSRVHKYDKKMIFNISASGGTSIDDVIDNIKITKIPSMVLSDGDDHISVYDNKAYLFTICSALRGSAMNEYAKQGQLVFFNNGKFQYGRLINENVEYVD